MSPLYGGDCYNYGLVASGHIDLVCEEGLKLHDFAALVPVVEGAGGRMCDWNGDPLTERQRGTCAGDRRSGARGRCAGGAARPRALSRRGSEVAANLNKLTLVDA